jgi:hypothetical protein
MKQVNSAPKTTTGFDAMTQVLRGAAVVEAVGKAAAAAGVMLPREVKMPYNLNPAEEPDIIPKAGVVSAVSDKDIAVSAAENYGVEYDTDSEDPRAKSFRSVVADGVNAARADAEGIPSSQLVDKGRKLSAMQEQLVVDGGVSSDEKVIGSTFRKLENLQNAGVKLPPELSESMAKEFAA